MPPNAWLFFSKIFEMISFDPIDLEEYGLVLPGLETSDVEVELEESFVQLGYESAYFLSNIGSLILVIIL